MAEIISQALPYLRQFSGKTFVIKYGGHAMGDEKITASFAKDIVLLKQVGINPVVVHGGGPQIQSMLSRLNIKTSFVDGLRVTDAETVDIVEMVLSGSINKSIVTSINKQGGNAIGISGKDGNFITVEKLNYSKRDPESNIDLGFVANPKKINTKLLNSLSSSDFIPVIAPVGIDESGQTYNINADTIAGAIASAVKAEKLIMLTDVPGVLDKEGNLISHIYSNDLDDLKNGNIISGGMIPKIETCIKAVNTGTKSVTIVNGKISHVILLEIFTPQGMGTMISNHDPEN